MSYIGNTNVVQNFTPQIDYFSGNGSTTAFTLSRPIGSVAQVQAVIENVPQNPGSAFTISGNVITFTSAPPTGTNNIYVYYTSPVTQAIAPSAGTVGWNSLNSDAQSKFGVGFKNRIINGAMAIDQRNAGASVTLSAGADQYTLDRFDVQNNTTSGAFTCQQSSTAPAGFVKSMKITITATEASPTSTMKARIWQAIEGFNVSDLAWGTSDAKTVTLSFWVQSSVTGTFGGALGNGSDNRAYPFTYTISSANTWEQKSITITGDTTGTWATNNTTGIMLNISLLAGTSRSGTAGAWNSNWNISATGATNLLATNGATFYLTGVQLEVGTQATAFDYRDYGRELAMCQRYYAKISGGGYSNYCGFASGFVAASTQLEAIVKYPVTMRASATINYSNVRTNTVTGTNSAITSILASYAGTDSINVTFNSTGSSMTNGQGASIVGNNNSSAYLELSAEL